MHHKKGKSLGLKRFLKHSVRRNIIRKMMTKQLYWQLAMPVLNYSFPNLLILKVCRKRSKSCSSNYAFKSTKEARYVHAYRYSDVQQHTQYICITRINIKIEILSYLIQMIPKTSKKCRHKSMYVLNN